MPQFFTAYDRPESKGLVCPENSLTEQVYKDQCDLNFLVQKYHLEDDPFSLKMLIDPNSRDAVFLDSTEVPDIYTALYHHQQIKTIFETLSYETQKKFDFSVDAFAEYCLTAPIKDVEALGVPNLRFSKPSDGDSTPTPTPTSEKTESESKA